MRATSSIALIAAAGCSFAVDRPPKTVSAETAAPDCTERMSLPGLDFAAAGVATLGGLAADDGAQGLLLGTGALLGIVGVIGSSWVKDCRRKKAAYRKLALEAPVAAGARAPGKSETAAAPETAPEPAPETAPETDAVEAEGSCPAGRRCPAGQRCDPVRHRCVAAEARGTESGRCRRGAHCDPGLYCDLDRRVCLPGDLGLEGGACQFGGRCRGELVCAAGLCVRPTSSGSIRRPKAPRPSRAAGPPRPDPRTP